MVYYAVNSDAFELRGIMHQKFDYRESIILIVHGYFSSNKIGPHKLYYDLANALSKIGYISVRVDLRGMGESDGKIKDVRLDDHIADLRNILKDLKERYGDKDIILIGHCIGCVSVLGCLEENNNLIRKIILLTPMLNSIKTVRNFFSEDRQYRELKENGFTYRNGLYADATFFMNDYCAENMAAILQKSEIEYEIIAAEKDQYIEKEDMMNFFSYLKKEPVFIKNADHNFLGIDCRKELFYYIIKYLE